MLKLHAFLVLILRSLTLPFWTKDSKFREVSKFMHFFVECFWRQSYKVDLEGKKMEILEKSTKLATFA